MKNLYTIFIFLICSVSVNSCKDQVNDAPAFVPGVAGKITDSTGKALENVSIFFLFQQSSVPLPLNKSLNRYHPEKPDSFGFNLEQNFPNPVNHSTFIRFSLPQECYATLQIYKKRTDQIIYDLHDTLSAGYFQFYIENIIDSLDLINGIYRYTFHAIGKNKTIYHAEKEMFIVSVEGNANTRSDNSGRYFIPYADAYVGDTVIYKSSESKQSEYIGTINNSIRIVCRKDGYGSAYIDIQMFPSLIINHDVVLFEKKNP